MQRPFDLPVTRDIVGFLQETGIAVEAASIPGDTFLPGIAIRRGALLVDPERLAWPGDLLHEAGHIAVTDPALRPTAEQVSADPSEEMAAIAWSYAAAVAISIPAEIVFHAGGYRDGGASLAANFAEGRYVGVPMLQWYGMTIERGDGAYPCMGRWLR